MVKPLVRRGINPGALGGPWWRRGPLITEDANCVSHVYWRNGALVDSKGNAWTQNGTVPQVAASGTIPPGAGPFSDANYYSLGSGSDVLDFAGGVFTICMIVAPASSGRGLMANGDGGAQGYELLTSAARPWLVVRGGPAVVTAESTTAPISMVCAGLNGSTGYVKSNSGVLVTATAGTYTVPSGFAARLGRHTTAGIPWDGTIYEMYATTTAPSDGLFLSIMTQAASRLRRSLP